MDHTPWCEDQDQLLFMLNTIMVIYNYAVYVQSGSPMAVWPLNNVEISFEFFKFALHYLL
jgi:hypothetical protein